MPTDGRQSVHRPFLALAATLLLAACAGTRENPAPPEDLYTQAEPVNAIGARSWGDDLDAARADEIAAAMRNGITHLWRERGRPPGGIDLHLLALSGGGPDGAYAAGILNGWSEQGDRPEFAVVTGISVGALIAPLAFVGPEYDAALREAFTESDMRDVAEISLAGALMGRLGIADTRPLREHIAEIVDDAFLDRVAAEHGRGRQLLIGTTNLDAARPVVWNMGAIAAAGDLALFRDVMLASASIPGVFPPVPITVESGGSRFTELHVDGGVAHSVVIGPSGSESVIPRDLGFPTRWTFYIIQNNGLLPPYEPVEERLRAIVRRSVSTLIRAQTAGDLAAIYQAAQNVGADFRMTFVPPDITMRPSSSIDATYMSEVFERGRNGSVWLDRPPDRLKRRELQQLVPESSSAAKPG